MSERRRVRTEAEIADEIDEITESILGVTEMISSGIYGPWTQYRMGKSDNRDEFLEKLKADSLFALHVLTAPANELANEPNAIKYIIDEMHHGLMVEPRKWNQLLKNLLELHAMRRSDTTEYANYISSGEWHEDFNAN